MSSIGSEYPAMTVHHEVGEPSSNRFAVLTIYGVLFAMFFAPLMSLGERSANTGEGNPLRQLIFISVFALAIAATRVPRLPGRIFALPLSLGLTLLYCWISLRWSIAPGVAARRLVLTTTIMLAIFMVVPLLKFEDTTKIIKKMLIGVLIANYVAVLLFPRFGIHGSSEVAGFGMDPTLIGSWKGILAHKNFAGSVAAFTVIFFLFNGEGYRPWVRALIIAATLVFLYKTSSKTSAGIMVGSIAVGYLFLKYDHYYRKIVIPCILLIIAALIGAVFIEWSAIFKTFNRPDAFTGRMAIWRVLWAYAADHPWGSGYGSFFNVGADMPIQHYVDPKNWVALVPEAHNGYLGMRVELGRMGFFLGVLSLILIPVSKLLVWKSQTRTQGALLIALVIFCAGHNFTESSFLDRDAIVETFLLFSIALIENTTSAARNLSSHRETISHG